MKRIIFFRHAKAVPEGYDVKDYDRPINTKGKNAALLIIKELEKLNMIPEKIICSAALRTQQTATLLTTELGLDDSIIEAIPDLYQLVGVGEIQDIIEQQNDLQHTIAFVGHNPWISIVAERFSKKFNHILPTAGLVILEFDALTWFDCEIGNGEIIFFEYPKKHM